MPCSVRGCGGKDLTRNNPGIDGYMISIIRASQKYEGAAWADYDAAFWRQAASNRAKGLKINYLKIICDLFYWKGTAFPEMRQLPSALSTRLQSQWSLMRAVQVAGVLKRVAKTLGTSSTYTCPYLSGRNGLSSATLTSGFINYT